MNRNTEYNSLYTRAMEIIDKLTQLRTSSLENTSALLGYCNELDHIAKKLENAGPIYNNFNWIVISNAYKPLRRY